MNTSTKINSENGSMAVYVSIVLLSMLLIITAVFLTSNAIRKSQLSTVTKVKESYEKDLGNVDEIYDDLTQDDELEYTQRGLILCYDGIDNTGTGHSSSATTWKDLSGNGNDGILSQPANTSNFNWGENCITLSNNSEKIYVDTPVNLNNSERTIVYTVDTNNLTGTIWGDTDSNNSNGLFNFSSFIANRGSNNSQQSKYDFNFTRSGIYCYAVSLSSTELKFYENGQLKATVNNTMGLKTNHNMRILAARYTAKNQSCSNIKMYNFLIYDRVLNDSEIQNIYIIDKIKYGF